MAKYHELTEQERKDAHKLSDVIKANDYEQAKKMFEAGWPQNDWVMNHSVQYGDVKMFELACQYADDTDKFLLEKAIDRNDAALVKAVIDYEYTEFSVLALSKAAQTKNPAIIRMVAEFKLKSEIENAYKEIIEVNTNCDGLDILMTELEKNNPELQVELATRMLLNGIE